MIKKPFVTIAVLAALVGMVGSQGLASAYTGTYTGGGQPQFNIYNDVIGVGNEKDFLRIGPKGATAGQFTNQQTVCDGEADLWFYVHNGAPEGFNGTNFNGTGVAKDTKIKVALPGGESKDHTLSGTISANNAASVMDTAKLVCGTDAVSVSYVAGTTEVFSQNLGTVKLNAQQEQQLLTSGTQIGSHAMNGVVPGCWEFRVWVKLTVKVKKQEKPVGNGVCKATDLQVIDKVSRKVKVTVNGQLTGEGASIVGYRINWGDGTAFATTQTAEHSYAKDGTYTVTGEVRVRMPDGSEKWVSAANCVKQVTFKKDVPPTVVTVTTLPKTGAGSMLGIFAATTAAGALAHRKWLSRRS
jgi:hypothetical protein